MTQVWGLGLLHEQRTNSYNNLLPSPEINNNLKEKICVCVHACASSPSEAREGIGSLEVELQECEASEPDGGTQQLRAIFPVPENFLLISHNYMVSACHLSSAWCLTNTRPSCITPRWWQHNLESGPESLREWPLTYLCVSTWLLSGTDTLKYTQCFVYSSP